MHGSRRNRNMQHLEWRHDTPRSTSEEPHARWRHTRYIIGVQSPPGISYPTVANSRRRIAFRAGWRGCKKKWAGRCKAVFVDCTENQSQADSMQGSSSMTLCWIVRPLRRNIQVVRPLLRASAARTVLGRCVLRRGSTSWLADSRSGGHSIHKKQWINMGALCAQQEPRT